MVSISAKGMIRLVVAGAVLVAGVSFVSGNAQASSQQTHANFKTISVSSGDTLWSLAGQYAGHHDRREWIENLIQLNNLNTSDLQPGQHLALPN